MLGKVIFFAAAVVFALVAMALFELAGEACGQSLHWRVFEDGRRRQPGGFRLAGIVFLVLALICAGAM